MAELLDLRTHQQNPTNQSNHENSHLIQQRKESLPTESNARAAIDAAVKNMKEATTLNVGPVPSRNSLSLPQSQAPQPIIQVRDLSHF